jgi:hypothetical protein
LPGSGVDVVDQGLYVIVGKVVLKLLTNLSHAVVQITALSVII